MEKEVIQNIVQGIKTKNDLLILINTLKRDELKDRYVPYTIKQLNFYCNPKHIKGRYKIFTIPKKSGGKREIASPRSSSYRNLLRYINIILQSIHVPSEHTMGFVPNKCIVDNAIPHIGHNYVFNVDLKDFFPSVEQARIWGRLQVPPFSFTPEVASCIAGLCCRRVSIESDSKEKVYKYVLPQGSPASPTLTNIVCDKLDFLLHKLCLQYSVTYTRYADDMSFSSNHNVYQSDSRFMIRLKKIVASQGFEFNEKKTRLEKIGARQEVTGLTISQTKVNVSRKYVHDLRSLLYIWEKYGYSVASSCLAKYNQKEFATKKGQDVANVVEGKLLFLKMVKGEQDSTYQTLFAKFDNIIGRSKQTQYTSNSGTNYIESCSVAEYEKKMNVDIQLVVSQKDSLYAKCTKIGEKRSSFISIQKDVPLTSTKEQLEISVCKNQQGKDFLLIHLPYKRKTEEVNIDQLNQELDDLLS